MTMTDALKSKDEATLDLFEQPATQGTGKSEMKAAKAPAKGKKTKKEKAGKGDAGKVAGGGGGKTGAPGSPTSSGDDFIDMALFAERSYLTYAMSRSEERRVGKECRSRWSPEQ